MSTSLAIQLSDPSAQVIGLYFSASYCKWCNEFSPKLESIYSDLKQQGVDIVLIGSDKTSDSYSAYASKQPWPVMPFVEDARMRLREEYSIKTIPALVFVDRNGTLVNANARSMVATYCDTHQSRDIVARNVAFQLGISTDLGYDSDNSDF